MLVQRVVNQQGLLLVGRLCELSSHQTVSQGDSQSIEDVHGSSCAYEDSARGKTRHLNRKSLALRLIVGVVLPLGIHRAKSVEKGVFGHSVVVEAAPSIVHSLESYFVPAVSNLNAVQRLVGLEVADLEHEGVDAVVLALDDELGPHDTHVGEPGQVSNPKLH